MTEAADLAYPEKLPDDLKVLLKEHKVPPNDPLIALLAWHWNRTNEGNDVLQQGIFALKAALDARLEKIIGIADALAVMSGQLEGLNRGMAQTSSLFGKQIETDIAAAIAKVKSLNQLLTGAESSFSKLRRERMVATFISGLSIGAAALLWIGLHSFSHF